MTVTRIERDPSYAGDAAAAGHIAELIAAGRAFDARGWMPATSGNLSARLADGRIAITASGVHKGALDADGILLLDPDGHAEAAGPRPSAETALHLTIYRRDPALHAVLHVHAPAATVLSRLHRDEVVLHDYELLKALAGIETHEAHITLPVFPNDQDIPRLAARLDAWLDTRGTTHGCLIAGHGLYAWGRSVAEARRHVEALEFLFDCELRQHRMQHP